MGLHKDTQQQVAVKIVDKTRLQKNPQLLRKLEREIAIMKLMDHAHVTRLYDVYQGKNDMYVQKQIILTPQSHYYGIH